MPTKNSTLFPGLNEADCLTQTAQLRLRCAALRAMIGKSAPQEPALTDDPIESLSAMNGHYAQLQQLDAERKKALQPPAPKAPPTAGKPAAAAAMTLTEKCRAARAARLTAPQTKNRTT